ncbi:hypothetical protein EVAR_10980_1 [Eumeta japonica]|uniref:Uncharacterized protein n=1 Tax=Eumeta variegata TaxID=151549 RepID=A0A4C1U666_EUMVA|nr:hypothetical protein EVAR_10980_1 [Eumeta japonica]
MRSICTGRGAARPVARADDSVIPLKEVDRKSGILRSKYLLAVAVSRSRMAENEPRAARLKPSGGPAPPPATLAGDCDH